MGKSAKFYKRPSRKEKESQALSKFTTPSPGIKKPKQSDEPKRTTTKIPTPDLTSMDLDSKPVQQKKKQPSKPDYVDLLMGKKTFKKIPAKRKKLL
ncbi:hypothetical protein BCR43DRAFT_485416 [Syncephalastrum racemosum]|uniref:Uncharacterized protein n=1 Tax=Syncephalastrum racemosum TaxID=13706 RepID=A0A1X2HMH5_SYNRA|nr:hypothetical protein BCR43DRAFT_485416 [Syncephalastrum racemosum]